MSAKKSRKTLAVAAVTSGAMAVTLAFTTLGASGATSPRVQHPSTAIPKAQALLKALLKRPTRIPVTVKITKPIPKNKTIDFVVCGVPQCAILVNSLGVPLLQG